MDKRALNVEEVAVRVTGNILCANVGTTLTDGTRRPIKEEVPPGRGLQPGKGVIDRVTRPTCG